MENQKTKQLSRKHIRAWSLYYIHGLKQQEIAEMMEISRPMVTRYIAEANKHIENSSNSVTNIKILSYCETMNYKVRRKF